MKSELGHSLTHRVPIERYSCRGMYVNSLAGGLRMVLPTEQVVIAQITWTEKDMHHTLARGPQGFRKVRTCCILQHKNMKTCILRVLW